VYYSRTERVFILEQFASKSYVVREAFSNAYPDKKKGTEKGNNAPNVINILGRKKCLSVTRAHTEVITTVLIDTVTATVHGRGNSIPLMVVSFCE
jgi:hypothetical protein